jgi:hypothetical protein
MGLSMITLQVAYDVARAQSVDGTIRGAALACIAELSLKIAPEILRPHVRALLTQSLGSLSDATWSVRDGACTALSRLITVYPEQTSEEREKVISSLFERLHDNVWSVREDAAVALGLVASTFRLFILVFASFFFFLLESHL